MGLVGEEVPLVNGDNHYVGLPARPVVVVTYGFDKRQQLICFYAGGHLAPHRLAVAALLGEDSLGASVGGDHQESRTRPPQHERGDRYRRQTFWGQTSPDRRSSRVQGARRRFTHVGDDDGVTRGGRLATIPPGTATLDSASPAWL